MYKSRKRVYLLCLLLLILMGSSSCSLTEEAESKADEKEETYKKEDYLDIKRLAEEKKKKDEMKTYKIQYGIFEEKALNVNAMARRQNYISQPIKVTAKGENMVLQITDKLENFNLVEKGDVLATIDRNETSTDILEAELKLQKLQNNLNRESKYYQEEYEKKVEEHEKKKKETEERKKNDFTNEAEKRIYYLEREKEVNIESCLLEREVLEWENKKRSYEREIQNTQKELEKIQKEAEAATIVAQKSGYVITDSIQMKIDEHINYGDIICNIINYNQNLLWIDNRENIYSYGMECNMRINTGSENVELMGRMINGGSSILYGNLDNSSAFFSLDIEEKDDKESYQYFNSGKIIGELETIENVLLVPIKAVTVEDDIPYVTVMNEDGSFLKTGFTPGGSNSEYYWILSGLEEGMQILVTE